ncbi:MAG: hypothetical protein KAH17_04185 [Bacteroidales bacterium]|nr:hypothetical protein [Bacteroidales bacterium]
MNKFKYLRNKYVKDTLSGLLFKIVKVKMVKISESDYAVKIHVESDLDKHMKEIDSVYATNNFKEINL